MGNAGTSRARFVLTLTALTVAIGAWGVGVVRWIGQANANQVIVIPVRDQIARASGTSGIKTKASAAISNEDELALARAADSRQAI